MEKESILQALQSKGAKKNLSSLSEEDRKIEILTILSELPKLEDRSGKTGRSLRKRLRDMGFRLSNPEHVKLAIGWTNELV